MFDPDQSKVKSAIEEAEAFQNGYDRQKNDRLGDNSDLDSDYENSDEEKVKYKYIDNRKKRKIRMNRMTKKNMMIRKRKQPPIFL